MTDKGRAEFIAYSHFMVERGGFEFWLLRRSSLNVRFNGFGSSKQSSLWIWCAFLAPQECWCNHDWRMLCLLRTRAINKKRFLHPFNLSTKVVRFWGHLGVVYLAQVVSLNSWYKVAGSKPYLRNADFTSQLRCRLKLKRSIRQARHFQSPPTIKV